MNEQGLQKEARVRTAGLDATLVSWVLGAEMVTAGLAFGWLQHLVFDQLTNGARPLWVNINSGTP